MHFFRIISISLSLAALLAGCATPVSTNIQPTAASLAKYGDMTDINIVAALEKNVNDAKAADMPFLAPNYFKEASQILSESKTQLGNRPKEVLAKNAARADAILEKGRAVMAIVKYRFAQELEIKARLDALNTQKLLPAEYKAAMEKFSSLIAQVEREQPGNLDKDMEALVKTLQELEVRAVQEGALREAETINAASKKNNAEKQAPLTFAEAQRVFLDAKKQIAAAPHDEKLVQRLGTQALFAARHAQQVNARVALLSEQLNVSSSGGAGVSIAGGGGNAMAGVQVGGGSRQVERATLEKIVLLEEDRLLAISTALGLKDLRDLPLDKQVEEIRRAAAELAGSSKGAAIQDLEARLKTATDATQKATVQLAAKDQQLKDQAAQLAAKDQQMADKDAQINALKDTLAKQQGTKKPVTKKPKTKQQDAKPQAK
jgi:hypothetical protein